VGTCQRDILAKEVDILEVSSSGNNNHVTVITVVDGGLDCVEICWAVVINVDCSSGSICSGSQPHQK